MKLYVWVIGLFGMLTLDVFGLSYCFKGLTYPSDYTALGGAFGLVLILLSNVAVIRLAVRKLMFEPAEDEEKTDAE